MCGRRRRRGVDRTAVLARIPRAGNQLARPIYPCLGYFFGVGGVRVVDIGISIRVIPHGHPSNAPPCSHASLVSHVCHVMPCHAAPRVRVRKGQKQSPRRNIKTYSITSDQSPSQAKLTYYPAYLGHAIAPRRARDIREVGHRHGTSRERNIVLLAAIAPRSVM